MSVIRMCETDKGTWLLGSHEAIKDPGVLGAPVVTREYILRSEDQGKTWTAPKPTVLVHPDAPAMLFHLADGKTLVAFHHNVHGGGHFNYADRSQIWVSLSTDEGRTWSEPRFVFCNALDETLGHNFRNYQCS
jgi:photosystem II stability/assembly factor-like uncharacterized protein